MTMKTIDRKRFEERLRQQLQEVSGRMTDHQGMCEPSRGNEVDQGLADSEESLIEKITFALMRLEEGTYGECTECGAEIPLARLEAKPSVSLCLDCQTRKEQDKN